MLGLAGGFAGAFVFVNLGSRIALSSAMSVGVIRSIVAGPRHRPSYAADAHRSGWMGSDIRFHAYERAASAAGVASR